MSANPSSDSTAARPCERVRPRRGELGMTLTELIMAATLMVAVLGVGLALLPIALKSEPRISTRAAKVQEGRALIERLTREIRQGYNVIQPATATQVVFQTYVRHATCGGASGTTAIQCRVTYTCTGGTCTRTEQNPDGTGGSAPVRLASGLGTGTTFLYQPSSTAPKWVGVRLVFSASGTEDAVTLEDGAALRNLP